MPREFSVAGIAERFKQKQRTSPLSKIFRPTFIRALPQPEMTQPAKLALEDGTVLTGTAFGAEGEVDGEVCFNTSMTGYQEILTDPSYRGQIVDDDLSGNRQLRHQHRGCRKRPAASGRASSCGNGPAGRATSAQPANSTIIWPNGASSDWPASTRGRSSATFAIAAPWRGVLSTIDLDDRRLVAKAKASPGLVGRDLVREVMPSQPRDWQERLNPWARPIGDIRGNSVEAPQNRQTPTGPHVVAHRLRHEMEHRPASGRNGLPRDDSARHGLGRRSSGPCSPTACFFPMAPAIPSR